MTGMKRWGMLSLLLALSLPGCTLANFWLSDCGGADADLVVINNSSAVVGSITLDYGDQTEVIANAEDRALLERGEYCGLELAEEAEQVLVSLAGLDQRELASCLVSFEEDRLYLTLEEDGTLSCSLEWPEEAG